MRDVLSQVFSCTHTDTDVCRSFWGKLTNSLPIILTDNTIFLYV